MQERSGNEAESKANPSGSQAPQHVPTFQGKHVLDAFSGAFCDRTGWAELTIRTVDGSEFKCFVDGIVAKAFSDRLLGLAGRLLLQSHGESADLRPLHELGDDEADDERPLPPNLPAMAPQPHPEPKTPEDFAAETPDPIHDLGTLGTLAETSKGILPSRDEATKEFLESFAGKPDEYFAGTFARTIARAKLEGVDQDHPDVIAIKVQLAKFPE